MRKIISTLPEKRIVQLSLARFSSKQHYFFSRHFWNGFLKVISGSNRKISHFLWNTCCSPYFLFLSIFVCLLKKANVWHSLKSGRLGPHLEPILYIGHKERQEGSRDRSKLTTSRSTETATQTSCPRGTFLPVFFFFFVQKALSTVSAMDILTINMFQ